jgi:biofilm PGA synthesis protein PgaD
VSAAPDQDFAPATIPRAPFEAPLILDAPPSRRWARLRETVLTAVVWVGWLYLLAATLGVFWIPPFVHYLLPIAAGLAALPILVVVGACLAIAAVIMTFVMVRTLSDRRRFAGADRRREGTEPTDAELAASLGAETLDPATLRGEKRIVMHHGKDGRMVRAELGWDVPPGGTPE